MNFYKKILKKILPVYKENDIPTLLKARFFFFMCLIMIAILPIMISYTIYLHLNNPDFGYSIQYHILAPQVAAFIFVIFTSLILAKGYFEAAAHLLLITLFAVIWLVMSADKSYVVSRLDTIILAVALMSLVPLAASKQVLHLFFTEYLILLLFTHTCFISALI